MKLPRRLRLLVYGFAAAQAALLAGAGVVLGHWLW